MKKIVFSFLTIGLLAFSSCTNEPSVKSTDKEETTTKVAKHYTLLTGQTAMRWTAFKFTERLGVIGTFNKIMVKEKVEGDGLSAALMGLEFKIPVSEINSNNEDRDGKIINYFFGVMKETTAITGTFGEFNGDDTGGNCNVIINMNGQSKSVNFEYMVDERALGLSTLIDLNNWDGEFALQSINKKCEDLHKGTDGKSFIWPEVKLQISIPIAK